MGQHLEQWFAMRSKMSTNGHKRVSEKAGLDELTGVWNRAGFLAAATPVFLSCQRRDAPVSLAFFEFRTDARRPPDPTTIDKVLMGMAALTRKAFRASDVAGRVDPLRFVVLLGDCTDDALMAIDGVRALTDATAPERLTLTAGMVSSAPGGTLEDLLSAAELRARELDEAS
jgi:GGDEF domain-containing protein